MYCLYSLVSYIILVFVSVETVAGGHSLAAGGGCIVMSILIDGLGYTETKWNKVTTLY